MEYHVQVVWKADNKPFTYKTYTRDHQWYYGSGTTHGASAAPEFAGNAALVNPEEAFTAAVSSCHMLTFLAIAAKKNLPVARYEDNAEGFLEKNESGKLAMTRVILRPKVTFEGTAPTAEELRTLHEHSHAGCFIAQSVHTKVDIEPA